MRKKLLICLMMIAMLIATFGTVSVCAVEDATVQPGTTIEDVVTEDSSAEVPVEDEEMEKLDGEQAEDDIQDSADVLEGENAGKEFIQNELLPMLKNILVSLLTFALLIALLWNQVKSFFESIKDVASKCGIATDKVEKAKERLTQDVEATKEAMVKEVAEAKEEMEKVKAEIQKSEGTITDFKADLESLQKKLDIFMRADKMAKLNDASLIASGVAKQIEEVYNEIKNG